MSPYLLAWPALGVFLAIYFRGVLEAWLGLKAPQGVEKDVLQLQAEVKSLRVDLKDVTERMGKQTLKSLMGKAS